MKKLFLASVAFGVLVAGTATASVAKDYTWTGFYIGAAVGAGWSDDNVKSKVVSSNFCPSTSCVGGLETVQAMTAGVPRSLSTDDTGVIGGGYIGYNAQIANNWILGAEFDFRGTDLDGTGRSHVTAPIPGFDPFSVTSNFAASTELNWLGSVRGRLGYLLGQRHLLYATGGFAFGDAELTFGGTQVLNGGFFDVTTRNSDRSKNSETLTGFSAGGGYEYALAQNWSIRAEYLYTDLGQLTTRTGYASVITIPFDFDDYTRIGVKSSADFIEQEVRVGVTYRFRAP